MKTALKKTGAPHKIYPQTRLKTLWTTKIAYTDNHLRQAHRQEKVPSSLGLVDVQCRLLGQYLRQEWSPHTSKIKLTNKIQSYTIYHNYYHKYTKTGFRPAELHLSTSTFLGNSSIFRLLNENAPISSPQIGDLQEVLSDANKLNQAKKTLLEQGSKDLARNERKHGSPDPDSKFLETYP